MTGFVPLESLTGLFLFITLACALMGLFSPNVWTDVKQDVFVYKSA